MAVDQVLDEAGAKELVAQVKERFVHELKSTESTDSLTIDALNANDTSLGSVAIEFVDTATINSWWA